MASDIGVKIALDGEREYRKSLSEIVNQSKMLASEMKLVTSGFDENTSAQKKAQAQAEVLRKEIANQEKEVALIAERYKKSAQATGENSEETIKLKTALNKAEAQLNSYKGQLQEAEKNSSLFHAATQKLGSVMKDGLVIGAKAAVAGVAALGTAVVAVTKKLADFSVQGSAYADEILTASTVSGIATVKLQEYKYAAELVDVSTETLTGSMRKNIKSMTSAQKGTGAAAEAYKALGVNVTTTDGKLRDSETVYWELIDALGKVSSETERDSLSMQIFGKSAQDLNPLIEAGADRMKELGQQAHDAGAVMSDELLKSFGSFNDQLQYLKANGAAAKNALGTVLLPVLNQLATEGNSAITTFTNALLSANGDMSQIGGAMSEAIGRIANSAVSLVPSLFAAAKGIITGIGGAIAANLPMIATSALKIVIALADDIIDYAPKLLDSGIETVVSLARGVSSALPELVPRAVEMIITIANTLLSPANLSTILNAALEILIGLAEGLKNAIPQLVPAVVLIIAGIAQFIVQNLPTIISAAVEIVLALGKGIIGAIPKLVSSIPRVISAIVSGLSNGLSEIRSVGSNLISGLWNGISDKIQWLKNKIAGLGQTILASIKSIFGIHSPSTVMRDQIGKNLALGIGVGFEDQMRRVSHEMNGALLSSVGFSLPVGGGSSYNYSIPAINVYAAPGQNANDVADAIMFKIQNAVNTKGAVYR